MNLRKQLLLVSLLTLILPWAGCQFIRETESALREVQEEMLGGYARAITDSLSQFHNEFLSDNRGGDPALCPVAAPGTAAGTVCRGARAAPCGSVPVPVRSGIVGSASDFDTEHPILGQRGAPARAMEQGAYRSRSRAPCLGFAPYSADSSSASPGRPAAVEK